MVVKSSSKGARREARAAAACEPDQRRKQLLWRTRSGLVMAGFLVPPRFRASSATLCHPLPLLCSPPGHLLSIVPRLIKSYKCVRASLRVLS
mgnify:FL=1